MTLTQQQSSKDGAVRSGSLHTRRWFEQRNGPVQFKAGDNVRIGGCNGVQTFSAEVPRAVVAPPVVVATHPFYCPKASASGVIVAGTLNGHPVTGSPLSINSSGTQKVYLKITMTLNLTANDYVMDQFATQTAWQLATAATVPADDSTHFYRQVASYLNGAKQSQDIITSMSVRPRDNGSGTHTATAIWWQS